MVITISEGSYTSEQNAVAREIVAHLRKLGLEVSVLTEIPEDAAHNVVLSQMRDEGFPICLETKERW